MKIKKFPVNGVAKKFTAYAVLKKEQTQGLCVLRKLVIQNGIVIAQEDSEENLQGVQMGYAIMGLEEAFQ